MSNEIASYLKYANLQMAAESLFGARPTDEAGLVKTEGSMTHVSLTDNNNRTNKFTETQAKQFLDIDGWAVVENKSNTATGFSGTLFKNRNTGELVMSFRSTEFIDDAARDNQATNDLEIKEKGWAFWQIADMQAWYASLQASGKISSNDTFTVTGYSLGGHLATAFNLLHAGDRNSFGIPKIAATYTFNGAGVGKVDAGYTLTGVITEFIHRRGDGNADRFTVSENAELYETLKATFYEGAGPTVGAAQLAQER